MEQAYDEKEGMFGSNARGIDFALLVSTLASATLSSTTRFTTTTTVAALTLFAIKPTTTTLPTCTIFLPAFKARSTLALAHLLVLGFNTKLLITLGIVACRDIVITLFDSNVLGLLELAFPVGPADQRCPSCGAHILADCCLRRTSSSRSLSAVAVE
jgi:hypothetical protein